MPIEESFRVRAGVFAGLASAPPASLRRVMDGILAVVRSGATLFLAGNGGSAAECQHFAAELVIRYRADRRALPAISLTTDTSAITACGNDFSFADVFARQVEALGRPGDGLVLLSTSGKSENLLRAAAAGKRRGLAIFGLLGRGGGPLAGLCDEAFVVPCDDTAIIQEVHLSVIHAMCGDIDLWATAGGGDACD